MTILEVLVSITLDAAILAGLLAALATVAHGTGQCWRLIERIETICRVEQLADEATGRAAAASWSRIDTRPVSLSFSTDDNGDGRIDGRSSESVAFEISKGRLIHRIGRQRVAIATAPDRTIHYRAAPDRPAPVLAEIPTGGRSLVIALPRRGDDTS